MSSDSESQIDSCLAYEVLRNPDDWIGCPSPAFLQSFLSGAQIRAQYTDSVLPNWRISGVLDEPAFYKQFVDATGRGLLTIKWATALGMTHFSLAEGYAKLREDALAWHRLKGVAVNDTTKRRKTSESDVDEFWSHFAKLPGLYTGNSSGWMLFCCLNGMSRGGDWLQLPEMPRLRDIFGGITARSEKAYGSPFAAFRVYDDAKRLLEWVGLPGDGGATAPVIF